MMTNVMMKTCLNQKIIKISNFIQAMKSSVCPKPKVIRRLNFSESRICPNIYRMFRSVDWTHGMIIVKWREVTLMIFPKAEFVRICPKIYRMFRSVDWTHDMIIVKWHLFIWHVRKLCALTCDPTVQSTEAGPWLKICLDQKIIKISNLIQAFKSSVCPKATNFALWQMRHRFIPRNRVNDYQRYSMLTVLPLRFISCTLGNSYLL